LLAKACELTQINSCTLALNTSFVYTLTVNVHSVYHSPIQLKRLSIVCPDDGETCKRFAVTTANLTKLNKMTAI